MRKQGNNMGLQLPASSSQQKNERKKRDKIRMKSAKCKMIKMATGKKSEWVNEKNKLKV